MRFSSFAAGWLFSIVVGCSAAVQLAWPSGASAGATLGARLSQGMADFVATLDEAQRDDALYRFDDDERFDLRLAPIGLEGLRLDGMTDAQWTALERQLALVLSARGLARMNTIRSLEREVADTEGGLFGFFFDWIRDPKRYYLAVFGAPAAATPWAMRFDGHHLSLNWTAVPGAPLSVTPIFFGGQPRVVPANLPRAGLRVLEAEEEAAIAFLTALSPSERDTARIAYAEGSAIRRPMSIAGDVDLAAPSGEGIRRDALSASAQRSLDALLDVHFESLVPQIAGRLRARMAEGPVSFVFASADAIPSAGRALYYRLSGGGLLIEFDNSSEAADHIHVVLRDPAKDFGRDVLAEHLREAHAR